jgi:50S ribosomal subunit-associated GTPase HflX
VPSIVALNKIDLTDEWKLSQAEEAAAGGKDVHRVRTSAKTGEGVESAFQWLAEATLVAKAEES